MSIIFDPVQIRLAAMKERYILEEIRLNEEGREHPQAFKDRKQLLDVAKQIWQLHRPIKTGRTEYTFHPSTLKQPRDQRPITGTAPTYRCASDCGEYFYEDGGCAVYLKLAENLGITAKHVYGLESV